MQSRNNDSGISQLTRYPSASQFSRNCLCPAAAHRVNNSSFSPLLSPTGCHHHLPTNRFPPQVYHARRTDLSPFVSVRAKHPKSQPRSNHHQISSTHYSARMSCTDLQHLQVLQALLHKLLHLPRILDVLMFPKGVPRPALGVLSEVVGSELVPLAEELSILCTSSLS